MTSDKKIAANRANAKKSTGPKTLWGKARAAQNARRHGLSSSIFANPVLSADVKILAREIVGKEATAEALELGHRIAEAQIDLVRIGRARYDLLTREDESSSSAGMGAHASGSSKVLHEAVLNSNKLAKLVALDRYERRAWSRRKAAIREFDAVRRGTSFR